jgi:transcriptional pleiotropic regulator of transition state genes
MPRKATGIVRKIDDLGRICIPMELRKMYKINIGDALEIYTDENGICLNKYNPAFNCVVCGEDAENSTIKGKPVCRNCIDAIRDIEE